jgi:threonine dehydrogenase-like Zn-dependent dehydrogenase
MSKEILGKCWSCGAALGSHDYGRESNCLVCGKPTRVCRNCRWFAPGRPNDCEEPMAEPVLDKQRANFCGFFEATGEVGDNDGGSSAEDLRKAAEELFKF